MIVRIFARGPADAEPDFIESGRPRSPVQALPPAGTRTEP